MNNIERPIDPHVSVFTEKKDSSFAHQTNFRGHKLRKQNRLIY